MLWRGAVFNKVDLEVDWPFVQIDTGDITQGSTGEIQLIKDDYIFQAYKVMGYDVVNVGLNELRLGIDKLKTIGDEYNIYWISSNTYSPGIYPDLPIPDYIDPSNLQNNDLSPDNPDDNPGADGNDQAAPTAADTLPLFKPYLIVELPEAPGYKIGFIGAMIQDAGRLNPLRNDFSFEPYAEAIQRNVEILRNEEKVDLVILLSDADNYTADVLSDEVFSGIDIVIGSRNALAVSSNASFNPLNPYFNETMALNYLDESGQAAVDESNGETSEESEGEEIDPFADIVLQPLTTPLMVPKAENRGRLVLRLDIFLDASVTVRTYWQGK
jgi:2',3'-cyclic-nucleotide 2'-phosphodiesterase (5'-nucleotidase family)